MLCDRTASLVLTLKSSNSALHEGCKNPPFSQGYWEGKPPPTQPAAAGGFCCHQTRLHPQSQATIPHDLLAVAAPRQPGGSSSPLPTWIQQLGVVKSYTQPKSLGRAAPWLGLDELLPGQGRSVIWWNCLWSSSPTMGHICHWAKLGPGVSALFRRSLPGSRAIPAILF